MQSILNVKNVSDERMELIKKLYDDCVDYRSLNSLKNKLIEIAKVDKITVSKEDYVLYKEQIVKNKMEKSEPLLLKEICDSNTNDISLAKFGEVIDLFNFFPVKVK